MIPDRDYLDAQFEAYIRRPASDAEVAYYVGKVSFTKLIDDLRNSQAYKDTVKYVQLGLRADEGNWESRLDKGVNKDSVIDYINKNLK